MNRTIKDLTVKGSRYDSRNQLRTHLAGFMAAYNFARRLRILSGLTPYEYICKIWTLELSKPRRRCDAPDARTEHLYLAKRMQVCHADGSSRNVPMGFQEI